MYAIFSGQKLNWARIIIDNMWGSSVHPYVCSLTRVFQHFGINFDGLTSEGPRTIINLTALRKSKSAEDAEKKKRDAASSAAGEASASSGTAVAVRTVPKAPSARRPRQRKTAAVPSIGAGTSAGRSAQSAEGTSASASMRVVSAAPSSLVTPPVSSPAANQSGPGASASAAPRVVSSPVANPDHDGGDIPSPNVGVSHPENEEVPSQVAPRHAAEDAQPAELPTPPPHISPSVTAARSEPQTPPTRGPAVEASPIGSSVRVEPPVTTAPVAMVQGSQPTPHHIPPPGPTAPSQPPPPPRQETTPIVSSLPVEPPVRDIHIVSRSPPPVEAVSGFYRGETSAAQAPPAHTAAGPSITAEEWAAQRAEIARLTELVTQVAPVLRDIGLTLRDVKANQHDIKLTLDVMEASLQVTKTEQFRFASKLSDVTNQARELTERFAEAFPDDPSTPTPPRATSPLDPHHRRWRLSYEDDEDERE